LHSANSTVWPFVAARTIAGQPATGALDLWGACWFVDNTSTSSSYFVPFNSEPEWTSFYNAALNNNIPGVTVTPCSRAMTQPVTLTPSADCLNPVPASATAQETNYYKWTVDGALQSDGVTTAAGVVWAPSAPFKCYPNPSDPSTMFVQTVTQYYGARNTDVLQSDHKTMLNSDKTGNRSWVLLNTTYSGGSSPVNGACSSADGFQQATACPSGSLANLQWHFSKNWGCDGGTLGVFGSYTWDCDGSNGGTNASCGSGMMPICPGQVDGVCGAGADSCVSGTVTNQGVTNQKTTDLGGELQTYTWTCAGINGGASSSCKSVGQACPTNGCATDGACGASANTCTLGTVANSADDNTTTTWMCMGISGGADATCGVADPICSSITDSCLVGTPGNFTQKDDAQTCPGGHAGAGCWIIQEWTCTSGSMSASCQSETQG
jgi:hypothetical protein